MEWAPLPFAFIPPGDVLASGIVLPIVCVSLVGIRFWIRIVQKAKLGADDWLVAVGAIMITGMGACLARGQQAGVMGYPTPVPVGTDPQAAYGLFIDAYTEVAKASFSSSIVHLS